MAESKALRKLVSLDAGTIRRLDDYRFGQRIGRESKALRRLIEICLNEVETDDRQSAPARR